MYHVSGLERLDQLDHLFVKQRACKRSEEITSWETTKAYDILDSCGRVFFFVKEENTTERDTIGSQREVNIKILDSKTHRPVISMKQPLEALYNSQEVSIFRHHYQADGKMSDELVGSVIHFFSLWQPSFSVKDSDSITRLRLERTGVENVEFQLLDLEDQQVGRISKRWVGLPLEAFTGDENNFGISFPQNLDLDLKAVLLGTCLLIDFLFYDKKGI